MPTKKPASAGRTTSTALSAAPPHALELEGLRRESLGMLRRRARLSAVASVVPLPGIDAVADIAMLADLLPKITSRFGLGADQLDQLDAARYAIAMKAIRRVGPTLIGKVVTTTVITAMAKTVGVRLTAKQASKYVPIVGSAVAAALGYTAFMALGKRHVDQCVAVRRALADDASTSTPR